MSVRSSLPYGEKAMVEAPGGANYTALVACSHCYSGTASDLDSRILVLSLYGLTAPLVSASEGSA